MEQQTNNNPVRLQFREVGSGRGVDLISSRNQDQFPYQRLAFLQGEAVGTQWPQGHWMGLELIIYLGVSLCPIGCLGPQPSGLKPKGVGSSSPALSAPQPRGNGLMLLAIETVGGEGARAGGGHLAFTGALNWQAAAGGKDLAGVYIWMGRGRDPTQQRGEMEEESYAKGQGRVGASMR